MENSKEVGAGLGNDLFAKRQIRNKAYATWANDPSDDNKKAYDDAEKAVGEASTAHNAHNASDHSPIVSRVAPTAAKVEGVEIVESFDEQKHEATKEVVISGDAGELLPEPSKEESGEAKEEAPTAAKVEE